MYSHYVIVLLCALLCLSVPNAEPSNRAQCYPAMADIKSKSIGSTLQFNCAVTGSDRCLKNLSIQWESGGKVLINGSQISIYERYYPGIPGMRKKDVLESTLKIENIQEIDANTKLRCEVLVNKTQEWDTRSILMPPIQDPPLEPTNPTADNGGMEATPSFISIISFALLAITYKSFR